jgi:hypothetical protein
LQHPLARAGGHHKTVIDKSPAQGLDSQGTPEEGEAPGDAPGRLEEFCLLHVATLTAKGSLVIYSPHHLRRGAQDGKMHPEM